MFQIRALNNCDDSGSSIEISEKDTEEAEETIVVTEYLRALNFMKANKLECALFLFLELIDTEALEKINTDNRDKLFMVKCNCYRNIGRIYQEKHEKSVALEYLLKAAEMDETDMHTLYSSAKLAFSIGNLQLAKLCYEKCIELNRHHWPSVDGLLEVFCATGNVVEAFSWAMQCYRIDNTYRRAIDVLIDIKTRFVSTIPFLEELFGVVFAVDININKHTMQMIYSKYKTQLLKEVYQHAQIYSCNEIQNNDWLTLGNWIIKLRDHFEISNQDSFAIILLDKMFNWNKESINTPANELCQSMTSFESLATYKADTMKKTESLMDADLKNRRRGSELKILEQWGWHKNRRSSRKKNAYDMSDPIESTADAFIKRALRKYFLVSFAKGISPFSGERFILENQSMERTNETFTNTFKTFCEISRQDLNSFVQKIQHDNIDLYGSNQLYLCHLSYYWDKLIPVELRKLYVKLYSSFSEFECFQCWIQFSNVDISNRIQIILFYLELLLDCEIGNGAKLFSELEYIQILNHMRFYLSCLPVTQFLLHHSRYLWLSYLICMQKHDYYGALKELDQMMVLIFSQSEILYINLPNQHYNNFYNKCLIQQLIIALKRKINLCRVENLYNEKKYYEIIDILKANLMCLNDTSADTDLLSISCQMEVLLECFWNLGNYSECLKWTEKALKYSLDIFTSLNNSCQKKCLAKTINFTLDYILALIEKKSIDILEFEYLPRMVQSIHEMLVYLLDPQQDKYTCNFYSVDCSKAWVILYYILEREDDKAMACRLNRIRNETSLENTEEETLFDSIMIFFVAHELLGRRQWCSNNNSYILLMTLDVISPKLRSPLLEPYRDFITECLEQTTHCLYGYPQKKSRTRHIQDHEASQSIMTWERAVQLFDIYRPDALPEFNSYKIDSISADMEAMFKHILLIFPESCNVSIYIEPIFNFVNGIEDTMPNAFCQKFMCYKIRPIYYLLADYYFKNRDFSKAIKFYIMDLTIESTRFDSWAGISLSKASKCETMLNSAEAIRCQEFLEESNNTMRCFEQCLKLNENDAQLRVEYGSFAYNVYSFCSRSIKHRNSLLSKYELELLEIRKKVYEDIAYKCFNMVINEITRGEGKTTHKSLESNNHEDEKWLYYYMLGKITEKRKEQPVVYLTHYLKSAKNLYDCNATYPIKVNHSNPSYLSIEALELFYRTTVAILKYTEQNERICKQTAVLFKNVLKELATSPFAVNRAKINDITIQRKIGNQQTGSSVGQKPKIADMLPEDTDFKHSATELKQTILTETTNVQLNLIEDSTKNEHEVNNLFNTNLQYGLRRSSQESISATYTTTLSTSNVTSSLSSTSDSINSEMDSTSESDTDSTTDDENLTQIDVRDAIYRDCIKNLEECITRFPEHYKSIYRLAYHYLYATGATRSLKRCRELMLGTYKTTLGNEIAGLFTERRNNNFFNGIWRIPSSDIDRPGSFASHLSKCVTVLIHTLNLNDDHKTLFELALQLYRIPDTDKKYLNERDRNTLFHKGINACIGVFQKSLKNCLAQNNDDEFLSVLTEIYKAYRKSIKHLQGIEGKLCNALIDGYKIFVHNKAKIPENSNILELAIKLCTYEINYRKTMDKLLGMNKTTFTGVETATTMVTPMRPISTTFIPGLTKQRKILITKESPAPLTSSTNHGTQGLACDNSQCHNRNIPSANGTQQSSSTILIHDFLPIDTSVLEKGSNCNSFL
ncbi:calcineurin-binding protein cabin-1-like [Sabethes cyaneus]|uniref:calcineurin-binding protein cabin-1-like n=1 Tax=Sabethes cyaneus TaxID=53552 RepID=UPI00237D9DF5|nr:calcineurin-binding protein cabin-1-like [Sabethes cyaneus]